MKGVVNGDRRRQLTFLGGVNEVAETVRQRRNRDEGPDVIDEGVHRAAFRIIHSTVLTFRGLGLQRLQVLRGHRSNGAAENRNIGEASQSQQRHRHDEVGKVVDG